MAEMDRLLKVVNEVEHLVCEDEELLREALDALKDRVQAPADRRCCPDCDEDGKAVDLIAKLEERLLSE